MIGDTPNLRGCVILAGLGLLGLLIALSALVPQS